MRSRRVHLCLPVAPSNDALALAQAIKDALAPAYLVRVHHGGDDGCDDITPVDLRPNEKPLLLRIDEGS